MNEQRQAAGTGLRERIAGIVSRISRIDASELQDDVKIREELGVDSLMAMEIVASCEKELDIHIDEGELYRLQTVGDFMNLVMSLCRDAQDRSALA
ncbi:MAG: acyl carrier protein [Spirochaetales bacterium]|nr:acyl carrier protein [Spirochaetales bacterium]